MGKEQPTRNRVAWGDPKSQCPRKLEYFCLFLLYHQWLLLLLKLYLRGTCFFPSLSRSISPTERKDSRLHNETQHANPADQDFLSMSSFPSRLAPSSSPHRSSSSILNHHSLSLSLAFRCTLLTSVHSSGLSLPVLRRHLSSRPPSSANETLHKSSRREDQSARLRRNPRPPRNDRHAKRQTHTKQSAVTVKTTTSNSGICQEGEKWCAAMVATSMSGWIVDGVGVAIGARTRVGVAVAPSSRVSG